MTPTPDAPWYTQGDPWTLRECAWNPDRALYFETIFTQSNGYFGVRGYTEEASAAPTTTVREAYLAGVFGHMDEAGRELIKTPYPWPSQQMLSLPELFGCSITLDGEPFTLAAGEVLEYERTLDLRNGQLTRTVCWRSPAGRTTRLRFDRFLSAATPQLAMQRIQVTPVDWSGVSMLHTELDGNTPSFFRCGDRAMPHPPQYLMEQVRIDTGRHGVPNLTITVRGTGHTVSVASGFASPCPTLFDPEPCVLGQTLTCDVSRGTATEITRALAVACSRDGGGGHETPAFASDIARAALAAGYEAMLAASAAVWVRRWAASDLEIDGPARDQAYLRFGTFSMLQMAPFHTDTMSIPARAYAYNRYHGLYYWDSETFLLPHYLHTHPEVARNLLRFRHRTLDGARRTAQRLGASGACYPWMADADDGTEQAPWGIGDYVWHQNADIAYALDQYAAATGDTDFMAGHGLEILVETARFWMSRIEEDADGVVHLHDTVGPDELDKHGRDNGYTSLMVRRHFRLAAAWLDRLRERHPAAAKALVEKLELTASEVTAWTHAADRLAVPNVPGRNFPLQDEFLLAKAPLCFDGLTADEAFAMRHTHRVVKQADIIVALFLLQDEFTVEQMREAYDFYEPMTLHYSSLSYNTHAIIAAKIGRHAQAYDYFMKAAGLDLDNLRDATKDGLHAAALAGTWQTVVYGFLGMRIDGDSLVLDPRLPDAWTSLRLTLAFRGFAIRLEIDAHGIEASVEGAHGLAAAALRVHGTSHALADGLRISAKLSVHS